MGNKVTAALRAFGMCISLCVAGAVGIAKGQDSIYSVKLLAPEIALKLARATLEACRKEGFQVSVAVTDRFGITQVLLRDRFAGPVCTENVIRFDLVKNPDSVGVDDCANSPAPGSSDRAVPAQIGA